MTSNEARLAALITPVEQEGQEDALALAAEGRTDKAIRRLRKNSGLTLASAPLALEFLARGTALPTTYEQALDALRTADAALVAEMTDLVRSGNGDSAIKLLRERTDIDLAGGYHLVRELTDRLGNQ